MIVVVDASVALKWFFRDRTDEEHVDRALGILTAMDAQRLTVVQPPHFVAEVAAVLAREKPNGVHDDLADLEQVDWRLQEGAAIYDRAAELAVRLGQHLFDTLYHAVALEVGQATLVTADRRYYRRARQVGRISLLDDFVLS